MAANNLRVLVADDEKTIRRFLKASLAAQGFHVIEAENGEQAEDCAVHAHPDLVILDLGLPDIDGLEVLKRIRRKSTVPVIILSVQDSPDDKVAALDAGADDYMTKPFDAGEMTARIRTVLRRLTPSTDENVYESGALRIDITKHEVTLRGAEVKLTPVEFDIIKLLVINSGRVVTHAGILKQVWGRENESEDALHLLRVTVNNLRNKLEKNPKIPKIIQTEPGVGYRLYSKN